MPGRGKLPSTLKRSPAKAQRTWLKTHDHAVREYGEGSRAHRTAFAALRHSLKDGRWVPKGHKGPSDPLAAKRGRAARAGGGETFGGVDYAGTTKEELYRRARKLALGGAPA